MSWAQKIDEWMLWTSEHLLGGDQIPNPRTWLGEAPWFNDFLDLLVRPIR